MNEESLPAATTEAEKILDWRRAQFTKLFPTMPSDDVETLARSKADLREARKLSEGGCNEHTAFMILA